MPCIDRLAESRRYRAKRKQQGLCRSCNNLVVPGACICAEHRDKKREYDRLNVVNKNVRRNNRKREDPTSAMADRLRKRIGRAIRDYAPGMKLRQTGQYIGCTMDEFMSHIESQFLLGMTWGNRNLWHIDHKRPCVSFNLTDLEQQKECFHYTNLQPMWAADNIRKHAKIV